MNNLDNLHSYDKVEYVQLHGLSEEELCKYCELKMMSAQSNVQFIEKEIWGGRFPLNICEIGGGNGKLLYCLEKKGILQQGVNYEVSKSRCDLANKFAEILSCKKVENVNLNFLEDRTKENIFDCIIMVDIVFQLITPLYDLAEEDLLKWVTKALKKGGFLVLEINDYSTVIDYAKRLGQVCWWEEFQAPDPFQYSLQKMTVDIDRNLINEKCFINRKGDGRDYFKNVIRSYKEEEITKLLIKEGFEVSVYQLKIPVGEIQDSTYRIRARKV